MRKVLRDPALQAEFDKNGFVIVPFLNESEVQELWRIYESLDAKMDSEFYLTIWSDQEEYKRQVHEKIVSIVAPAAERYLLDYKFIVSNFAVKKPGGKSNFDLHQGVNFVDESKYVSITAWVPLQDVNLVNGNMQIVRGSHKFFDQDVRSQHYPNPFENIKDWIQSNFVENLPMKAGQAWIFHHRLLHCSPPNYSDKLRLATLNSMAPKEAETILYYKHKDKKAETKVEILEFTEDNYFTQDVYDKPTNPGIVSRGYTDEIHYAVDKAEFVRLYEKYNDLKPA